MSEPSINKVTSLWPLVIGIVTAISSFSIAYYKISTNEADIDTLNKRIDKVEEKMKKDKDDEDDSIDELKDNSEYLRGFRDGQQTQK